MKNELFLNNNQQSKPVGKLNFTLLQKTIQNVQCYVITMNKKQTYVAFGLNEQLIIFSFKDDKLEKLQTIPDLLNKFTSLQFMNNSDDLISGQLNNQIAIWKYKQDIWYKEQEFKIDQPWGKIKILIIKNDILILSCHSQSQIRVWETNKSIRCNQILQTHKQWVSCINLNEEESRLVSCGDDEFIVLYNLQKDFKFKKVQRIITGKSGYQVCFIKNDSILFQPWQGSSLEVYSQSKYTDLFEKINVIQGYEGITNSYWYSQLQYNSSFQIILNLSMESLKVIKLIDENHFVLQQTLDFQTSNLFGTLSWDGRYLITWDDETLNIQLFKLNCST